MILRRSARVVGRKLNGELIVENLRKYTLNSAHVENGQENSAPEPVEQTQLPPEPVVMTLDLSSNGKWRLNSSTD